MSERAVKQLHLLVLGHPDCGAEFARWMDECAEVDRVDTLEDALHALRLDRFDAVVSSSSEFLPVREVCLSPQAAAVFDIVKEGVCIVSAPGKLGWTNPKMLSFNDEIRTRVTACCTELLVAARTQIKSGAVTGAGKRFDLTTSGSEHVEVHATPVIDDHNKVTQVFAVVRDVTRARGLQDKIDMIDRAGHELLSLDAEQFSRLDAQGRLSLLEQKILRCTRETLHFDNFEIRVLNKKNQKLELALVSGMPPEIVDTDLFARSAGNGICGHVASRGRSYICPDTSEDPRYRPGLKNARSSLTVPLLLQDDIVGVANFESTQVASFNEDDRQFAEIFARYIALALHVLELLVSERHTTTGRLGQDVMTEITGPLNDILTETETLVEDYLGHDDLRHRLRAISGNAVQIRETIKALTAQKPGLVGAAANRTERHDPILAGKRILVADDEDVIRSTVRDVLVCHGCEVSVAEDGNSATELLSNQAYDLVLSDIKMPGKSGYEVFAAAKEADPTVPVILTTGFGYDPNHAIVRARREGLAAVLFKPFKVDQLLGEIRVALSPSNH